MKLVVIKLIVIKTRILSEKPKNNFNYFPSLFLYSKRFKDKKIRRKDTLPYEF